MPTAADRLLILERLAKGDAATRLIFGGEAGFTQADGTRIYTTQRWPIPPIRISVGYTGGLRLLHAMERDGLLSHYQERATGNTLIWKLTSSGHRELEASRRDLGDGS